MSYDRPYDEKRQGDAGLSAEVILPLIVRLIHPRSVVDVGGAMGTWLPVAKTYGVIDLVLALEVAEHLPPESAKVFLDLVRSLGPVVLFSAAIPFQGATAHLNEQWPPLIFLKTISRLTGSRDGAVYEILRAMASTRPARMAAR